MILPRAESRLVAYVYDIADKTEPEKVREVVIEGRYLSSRRIGEHVYLIANYHPSFHVMEEGREKAETDMRPHYRDSTAENTLIPVPYQNIHYLPDSRETEFLVTASFNLEDLQQETNVETYLGASDDLYMSEEHLYTAVQVFPEVDERTFGKEAFPPVHTDILQFGVEEGDISYHASTRVEGTLINQFAMDERDDSFRVATTTGQWNAGNSPSTNNLYTFDLNLQPLGELEGLAEGERIYSIRFMEDKAYMVTFKQIDPLFVIDLENPAEPAVLGKLKIPGFSNYLHPLDENHLLGFGQNTKLIDQGPGEPAVRTDGIKMSVFDVSDFANPVEEYTEIIGGGGSYSELNHNHKALYQHPEKALFGFPVTLFEAKTIHKKDIMYQEQQFVFEGAMLYRITPDTGFELIETFTHQEEFEQGGYPDWENQLKRMVSVGDNLYTFSYGQMGVYDLETEQPVTTVDLPEMPDHYGPVYEEVE